MSVIDSIIDVGKGWIGTIEGGAYHKEIIDCYNGARYSDAYKMTLSDPWCAAFVVACFAKAGCADIIPCYASCEQMIGVFQKWGRWHGKIGYSPQKGDIIFYNWDGDRVSDHVGIVTRVAFNQITALEGNKSDTVSYRTVDVNDSYIHGFGSPNYSGSDSTLRPIAEVHPYDALKEMDKRDIRKLPLLFKGDSGIYVRILQLFLCLRGVPVTMDGEFGDGTETAVKKYQTKRNIECDGVVGRDTWSALILD